MTKYSSLRGALWLKEVLLYYFAGSLECKQAKQHAVKADKSIILSNAASRQILQAALYMSSTIYLKYKHQQP